MKSNKSFAMSYFLTVLLTFRHRNISIQRNFKCHQLSLFLGFLALASQFSLISYMFRETVVFKPTQKISVYSLLCLGKREYATVSPNFTCFQICITYFCRHSRTFNSFSSSVRLGSWIKAKVSTLETTVVDLPYRYITVCPLEKIANKLMTRQVGNVVQVCDYTKA